MPSWQVVAASVAIAEGLYIAFLGYYKAHMEQVVVNQAPLSA